MQEYASVDCYVCIHEAKSQIRVLPRPQDMELRDYQNTLISEARLALSRHKHIIVQSPTGSG